MARNRDTPRGSHFRAHAKNFFVTYSNIKLQNPDATFGKQELFDFLVAFEGVERLLVAEELHQDGNTHFHCYVGFEKRISFRNPDKFDFDGCHPNIQAARSVHRVVAYCTKDGNYLAKNVDVKIKSDIGSTLQKCIDEAMEPKEFVQVFLEEGLAGHLIRSYTNIRAIIQNVSDHNAACDPVRDFPDDFRIYGSLAVRLEDWVAALPTVVPGERGPAMRSLWLTGPSRLGKSQLARSLGRHWYMQGMWMVDLIDDRTALYGVLDDISWDSLKLSYKSILGMQKDVVLTDKYRHKRKFTLGRPVIVITNERPIFSAEEQEWLDANVEFIHVTTKLYE